MKRVNKLVFCGIFTVFTLFLPVNSIKTSAEQNSSECVMELESRRVLYSRNGDNKMPMASTTKILTAITVIENTENLYEEFEIPNEAIGVEGSSIYLKSGDKMSARDLLFGLMLRSGNDSAVALAVKTSGSIEKFSYQMNRISQKAGTENSNFVTPHGLPCKNHYTTSKDLCLISCYALHNEIFTKIVSTKFYDKFAWKNKNKMLYNYDGAIGIKTGYTKQAGRCLVSAVKKDGMTLVCTVLNCYDTYARSTELLNDAFKSYDNALILSVNTPVEIIKDSQKALGRIKADFRYPILDGEKKAIKREIIPVDKDFNKVKSGEIIGQIRFTLANKLIFFENLYKL